MMGGLSCESSSSFLSESVSVAPGSVGVVSVFPVSVGMVSVTPGVFSVELLAEGGWPQ